LGTRAFNRFNSMAVARKTHTIIQPIARRLRLTLTSYACLGTNARNRRGLSTRITRQC
jgi:hypothetical protein